MPITALTPVLDLLQRPPVPIPCEPGARIGHLFTGDRLEPIPVEPLPLSFRSGTEEVVQACRRELDGVFRLGRAVVGIDRDDIFVVTFGGEVRSQLRCPRLVLALPVAALARLLGRFDPALAPVADRLVTTPAAFAFLAGNRSDAPELRGYGILPAETLETPVREVIFCSEVFAGRALPGRFLVRVECDAAAGSDEDVLALAERELRRWSGTRAELGLRKLHRFDDIVPDGALAECRARLQGIGQRVPGLTIL